jgi:hypothetical protein
MIAMRLISSFLLIALAAVGIGAAWRQFSLYISNARASPPEESVPSPFTQEPEGDLFFAQSEVNLGLIRSDAIHDFEYENRGTVPVKIEETNASCSCTVVKPPSQIIQPGDKGHIRLVVHMRSDRIGPQAYKVDVHYKGTSDSKARLVVRVQYRPDVLLPDEVALQSITASVAKVRFDLVDFRDEPLEIGHISTTNAHMKVRIVEKPTVYLPGWRYVFELEWMARGPSSGTSSESIVLHTNDPDRKVIVIPARLEQVNRLRITPETLYIAGIIPGENGLRTGVIFLSDRNGDPVHLEAVRSPHEGLKCKIHPHQAGAKIEIQLDQQLLSKDRDEFTIQILVKKPVVQVLPVKVVLKFASTPVSP